jgi:diguanylate cyclase (GGDEF)-like protein/PAS domain S-box-containing protein
MAAHSDASAATQLRAERDFLAAVLDRAGVMLVVFDRAGVIERVNAACATTVGVPADQLAGRSAWEILLPETDGEEFRARLAAVTPADFPLQFEHVWVGTHGNRHRVAWTYTALTNEDGDLTHVVGAGIDVTEQRRAEADLRLRAETDPLTGVPNRTAFESALAAHLDPAVGLGCGLLFCDVDGFKAVNDTFGHGVGDQVLQEITARLKSTIRDSDLIARLGGDEFVILLPGVGSIEVRALAARIERIVRRPHHIADGTIRVGISVGVRVANAGDEPAAVLKAADADMYAVKSRRNRALTVA